jgi:hypothetical protein
MNLKRRIWLFHVFERCEFFDYRQNKMHVPKLATYKDALTLITSHQTRIYKKMEQQQPGCFYDGSNCQQNGLAHKQNFPLPMDDRKVSLHETASLRSLEVKHALGNLRTIWWNEKLLAVCQNTAVSRGIIEI